MTNSYTMLLYVVFMVSASCEVGSKYSSPYVKLSKKNSAGYVEAGSRCMKYTMFFRRCIHTLDMVSAGRKGGYSLFFIVHQGYLVYGKFMFYVIPTLTVVYLVNQ